MPCPPVNQADRSALRFVQDEVPRNDSTTASGPHASSTRVSSAFSSSSSNCSNPRVCGKSRQQHCLCTDGNQLPHACTPAVAGLEYRTLHKLSGGCADGVCKRHWQVSLPTPIAHAHLHCALQLFSSVVHTLLQRKDAQILAELITELHISVCVFSSHQAACSSAN